MASLIGPSGQWMLLGEPKRSARVNVGLYDLVVSFISAVLWRPSLFVLPAVYASAICTDRRILRIGPADCRLLASDRSWASVAIYHPVCNFPLLVSWFGNPDNLEFGLLAIPFWLGQAAMLILLLFEHEVATEGPPNHRRNTPGTVILALSCLMLLTLTLWPSYAATWFAAAILAQIVSAAIGPRWFGPQ